MPTTSKTKTLQGLGQLQSEVLELVWQRGEATVADVVKQLGRRRPITYTTVLVAMQKLEKKGWLTHRSEGRAYVYQPARSKAKAQAGALREILDAVFGGDPKLLVTQLLDARPWTPEELADLRRLIEQRAQGRKNMNPLVSASSWLPAGGWERLAADALWQSTALAGAGLLVGWLVRRRAALRAAVLLAAAILSIAVPALVECRAGHTARGLLSTPITHRPRQAAARSRPAADANHLLDRVQSTPQPSTADSRDSRRECRTPPLGSRVWPWLAWVWLAVSGCSPLRLARGWFGLRRAIRSAEPCYDPAIRGRPVAGRPGRWQSRPPQVLMQRGVRYSGAGRLAPAAAVGAARNARRRRLVCRFLSRAGASGPARRASRLVVELCLVAAPLAAAAVARAPAVPLGLRRGLRRLGGGRRRRSGRAGLAAGRVGSPAAAGAGPGHGRKPGGHAASHLAAVGDERSGPSAIGPGTGHPRLDAGRSAWASPWRCSNPRGGSRRDLHRARTRRSP